MPKKKSPHGTARRYWSGCRCAPCLAAHNIYCRDNHRAKRGNPVIDAGDVRTHLQELQKEHHVFVDAIALLTGISRTAIMQLRNGRKTNLRKKRAESIMSIGPWAAAFNGDQPADVAVHQLQVLIARGITQKEIGARLGLKSKIHMPGDVITAKRALRIRRLFGEVVLWPPKKMKAA